MHPGSGIEVCSGTPKLVVCYWSHKIHIINYICCYRIGSLRGAVSVQGFTGGEQKVEFELRAGRGRPLDSACHIALLAASSLGMPAGLPLACCGATPLNCCLPSKLPRL